VEGDQDSKPKSMTKPDDKTAHQGPATVEGTKSNKTIPQPHAVPVLVEGDDSKKKTNKTNEGGPAATRKPKPNTKPNDKGGGYAVPVLVEGDGNSKTNNKGNAKSNNGNSGGSNNKSVTIAPSTMKTTTSAPHAPPPPAAHAPPPPPPPPPSQLRR